MEAVSKIIQILPKSVAYEILKMIERRGREIQEISEIRVRACARSSFIISGERVDLFAPVCEQDVQEVFLRLCDGALYAHRDTIREGYISYYGGVRVGVCGEAKYEGCSLIGVSSISSLVFRIPTLAKHDISEICDAWKKTNFGMLIYSPPGVGKTTALRLLARYIGGALKCQLAVIDERREFLQEEYSSCSVDILRGYRRDTGLDIALRTLSPDVIMMDEIGRVGEADSMLESLNSGVKIVATAHAASFEELKKRKSLAGFFKNGVFDTFVGISLQSGRRVTKIERFCN